MKKSTGFAMVFLAAFLLVMPLALARPVSEDSIMTSYGRVRAGITPDNPMHVFDRMFDSLGLAVTFDAEKKADMAMGIARERLLEAKLMIERNKANAAGIAQAEHARALGVVEDSVRGIHFDDVEAELEMELEFEAELKEHEDEIKIVRDGLELEAQGAAGRQDIINSVLNRIQARAAEAEFEIGKEKDNSILRLNAKTGSGDGISGQSRTQSRTRSGMAEVEIEDDSARGEFGTATDRRRGADKPEDNGLDDGPDDSLDDNNDISGREAEGELPRGADSPSDFDSTPGSRGGGSSSGGSSGGSSSGSSSGGGSTDD